MKYNHKEIDAKWQQRWMETQAFNMDDTSDKPKFYCLVEFPYPSGAGLHMGHPRSYTALDVLSRKRRMEGYNVLYPIGWDAFGLPTENYAIKTGRKPQDVTQENINTFRRQLQSLGISFDWSREVNTTDPAYYKWTQWMFLEFFKAGMAYKKAMAINWCPSCKTGLANEEVVNDACERCGSGVEKRDKEQWMIAITRYADRLIDDLQTVDYLPKIAKQQEDWIGRSFGAEVDFAIEGVSQTIRVFTTRPDTLFGSTYVVLAPEHPLIATLADTITNMDDVRAYQTQTKEKSAIERGDDTKEKTGVVLKGVEAINPANGQRVPVWVADYVMMGYGTGAIMAVPAHDERDYAFAKKFGLEIKPVVAQSGVAVPSGVVGQVAGQLTEHINLDDAHLVGIGVMLRTEDGRVVLQQRDLNTNREPGRIAPFGGGRNAGESLRDTAIRELQEELQLEVDVSRLIWIGDKESHVHPETMIRLFTYQINEIPESTSEGADIITLTVDEALDHEMVTAFTKEILRGDVLMEAMVGDGLMVNSDFLNGLATDDAKEKMIAWLEKEGKGARKVNYRLRDWIFSRQRYWGEPIPLVHCNTCSPETDGWVALPVDQLPLTLPEVEKYEPTDSGESPLATVSDWVNTTCPTCGGAATRETDTMPNWAGSSWYFLRYIDPTNVEVFADANKLKQWMPVDWYNGGMEHTTLHLLYSRFWNKFLFDRGHVPTAEPYAKRTSQGLILAEDGTKMSKSKGNVVNPDELVEQFGADALRLLELFIGPFAEPAPYSHAGMVGTRRFLEKVMDLPSKIVETESEEVTRALHQLIQKVSEDIETQGYNTAVSALMIFVNAVGDGGGLTRETLQAFTRVLSPFAPHCAEEVWSQVGEGLAMQQTWPAFDAELAKDDVVTLGVQVNGKVRGQVTLAMDATEAQARAAAEADAHVQTYLQGKTVKKFVYVPGRIVSFVVT